MGVKLLNTSILALGILYNKLIASSLCEKKAIVLLPFLIYKQRKQDDKRRKSNY